MISTTYTGASIPPSTLEQVLPSPFPCPSPSPPFPLLSVPLPLEVAPPLLRLRGLGERFSSPYGSGRSAAAKRCLVNFKLTILPLVATNFRSFLGNETSNW